MKQRILDKVEEAFLKAEKFYNRKFSRPDQIIFKMKGTTAGTCNYTLKYLTFQLAMAEQEGNRYINDTPAHEVAHWIDRELYGFKRTPRGKIIRHGRTWKYIMMYVMDQDPERCHSFDVKNFKRKVTRQKFEYSCTGGHNLMVSSVCHNRITNGTHRYKCKCGGRITLKVSSVEEQVAELQARIKLLEAQKQKSNVQFQIRR